MPQFDQMYYDQKWSVWDTIRAFGRTIRVYMITAGHRTTEVITTSKRRVNVISSAKRRVKTITGV